MKTGIELITEERQKQIDKHGFTGEHHANHPKWYDKNQLIYAARFLALPDLTYTDWVPTNWDRKWFKDLCLRSHEERLKIAGALIAAEIDRLQKLKEKINQPA